MCFFVFFGVGRLVRGGMTQHVVNYSGLGFPGERNGCCKSSQDVLCKVGWERSGAKIEVCFFSFGYLGGVSSPFGFEFANEVFELSDIVDEI